MKLLTALAIAAAGPAAAQDLRPSAPRLESIEMETSARGRTVSSWSIDARGNGRLTRPEPDPADPNRLVTRRFAAGTRGFRELRIMLGLAEHRAAIGLPCLQRTADGNQGSVRWAQPGGRTVTLAYDAGCQDGGVRAVLRDIARAQALVAKWAAAGTVVEAKQLEKR